MAGTAPSCLRAAVLDRSPIDRSAAGRAKQERHPHVCGYSVPMDLAALAKARHRYRLNHSIVF
jgi:hypothetical protein